MEEKQKTEATASTDARRAFEVWADAHLTARAFVCEGDEPGEVTP